MSTASEASGGRAGPGGGGRRRGPPGGGHPADGARARRETSPLPHQPGPPTGDRIDTREPAPRRARPVGGSRRGDELARLPARAPERRIGRSAVPAGEGDRVAPRGRVDTCAV